MNLIKLKGIMILKPIEAETPLPRHWPLPWAQVNNIVYFA